MAESVLHFEEAHLTTKLISRKLYFALRKYECLNK